MLRCYLSDDVWIRYFEYNLFDTYFYHSPTVDCFSNIDKNFIPYYHRHFG